MNTIALLLSAALACAPCDTLPAAVRIVPPPAPRTAGREPAGPELQQAGPTVLLDCYYNNEWKVPPAAPPYRYHYVWSDTLDSGFSQLGGIIRDLGARIDTLCRPPTADRLARCAVYLIVDPDTPRETNHPETIDSAACLALRQWVRGGGILLLFGNDAGNAEFEHFNTLAGSFGIRFNENSRNRVLKDGYETGTFAHLPPHPLFRNVRRVFLKELSTLSLRAPAVPLLVEGGDVIMATARYGKGLVFAVGDPWLYNEYMDNRRLPAGYDNARAARNLFRWLFTQPARHDRR